MTREELIAYDRWLTENKWGSSEIITPEQAADLYLAKHPLPPAEGAEKLKEMEELFNLEQQLDIPMKDRFHNSAKGKELFAAIQNKPQPTAEGAEEILRRVINETIGDPGPGEFHWHIHQEIALKAMEKYANESIKFYYEGLMSDFNILLKDFYLWVDKNYALGMLTDKYDDVIKEYLEDKGKGKTLKSTHN